MMPSQENSPYQVYLLRFWRVEHASPNAPDEWRFVLEDVTRERRQVGFADFEKMAAFLRERIREKRMSGD
jgi:hypothetical protein